MAETCATVIGILEGDEPASRLAVSAAPEADQTSKAIHDVRAHAAVRLAPSSMARTSRRACGASTRLRTGGGGRG